MKGFVDGFPVIAAWPVDGDGAREHVGVENTGSLTGEV